VCVYVCMSVCVCVCACVHANHLDQCAVRQVPHIQLVLSGVSQRAAQILAVPTQVAINPSYPIHWVFVLLRCLLAEILGGIQKVKSVWMLGVRGLHLGVQRYDVEALVALQQDVRENVLGVSWGGVRRFRTEKWLGWEGWGPLPRPDLLQGQRRCAGDGLKDGVCVC